MQRGKEMLGLKIQATRPGFVEQSGLMLRRDRAACAAALDRICPAVDPSEINAAHLSDGSRTTARLDHNIRWSPHSFIFDIRNEAVKASVSISDIDPYCGFRKNAIMNGDEMPNEWLERMLADRPRGAKTALAEFLACPPARISKMLHGEKGNAPCAITIDEMTRIEEFFGEIYPPMHRNYLRFASRSR
jgi:hypothetical protein